MCLSGVTCNGHGTCIPQGLFGYTCNCIAGYIGKDCESSTCNIQPCLNGGTCITGGSRGYICQCPGQYAGEQCQLSEYIYIYIYILYYININNVSSILLIYLYLSFHKGFLWTSKILQRTFRNAINKCTHTHPSVNKTLHCHMLLSIVCCECWT